MVEICNVDIRLFWNFIHFGKLQRKEGFLMIALYIRLSLDDEKYDSMSIENQQILLREKAALLPE